MHRALFCFFPIIIGEHFGGRDHTTVIHSCQTVKDLMDTDGVFRENVLELQQKVQLAAM